MVPWSAFWQCRLRQGKVVISGHVDLRGRVLEVSVGGRDRSQPQRRMAIESEAAILVESPLLPLVTMGVSSFL